MQCNVLRQAPQCFQARTGRVLHCCPRHIYCMMMMRTMLNIIICHQGLHCLHQSCPIVSCMYMCISNGCCTLIVCAWHAACSISRACSKSGMYKTSTDRRYEGIFVGMVHCVYETMSSSKENNLWKALEQEGTIIISTQVNTFHLQDLFYTKLHNTIH